MPVILKTCKDILTRFFLPTATDEYIKDNEDYRALHAPKLQGLKDEVAPLKDMIEFAQSERSKKLRIWAEVRSKKESEGSQSNLPVENPSHSAIIKDFCTEASTNRSLISHLETLENSIKDFEYLINTNATFTRTGYRGLRDWAKTMKQSLEHLVTVISGVSLVGTGLVYATIFSATRGDISYMSFTFPLFSIGFVIPAVIQASLSWASHLHEEVEFASQPFWTAIIICFLLFSAICVLGAIAVLNLTVYWLSFKSETDGIDPWKTSGIAGIIAFAIPAIFFILVIGGFSLGIARNGIKAFRTVTSHHEKGKLDADNYKHV
ncbi:hypothetical protein M408DRAFT_23584 [Serendipita vermifera MAFF 305830]|uniref:Uncharacterized protein n=1 Tax=Serendipita vermifera MAFF 305830 TaxID=933852 RepID=A0A0C2WQQ6_SERVB|nr:hypothetical protein M408DRAFT_23584 [Serendipita vermifera MAFF 305830]